MTAERDYLIICIPIACGVAGAMLLSEFYFKTLDLTYKACATAMSLALSGTFVASQSKDLRRSSLLWIAIFFCCGALCHFENRLLSFELNLNIKEFFACAKNRVCAIIDSIPFNNRESNALVKALVTAERSSLSHETKTAFRNAGAAHMLALSGMHLGIIYLLVGRILIIIGNTPWARKIRSLLIILVTGLYTLMCGAGASLVRAWLFIALYEDGKMTGRPQKADRVLCAALTIHLIMRPCDIAEPGFQLSYLAMAGIVFVWPHMRGWYKASKNGMSIGRKIWDLMALSISCQLFTGALSYFYFNNFPAYFLVVNLIGAPLMTVVMICCVSALGLSIIGIDNAVVISILEAPITALVEFMKIFA